MADVLAVYKYASPAQTLVAVLNANGCASQYRYEQATDGHVVCLLDEDKSPQAQDIVTRFNQNPNAPEFTDAAWKSSASLPMPSGFSFRRIIERLVAVPLVSVVVLLCVLLYMSVYSLGQVAVYEVLFFQPFSHLADTHQWWRILTPALMHFSIEHLVFNLIWWGWLGSQIEKRLGWLWLLCLAVLLALFSNVAQYWVSGWQFGGMSGVVYGLTGYVWWMQWLRPKIGLTIPVGLVGLSLVWMVLGFAEVLWIDMANTAHLVGLVCGCCMALCHAAIVTKDA